jgi:hypothetical protein
MRTLPDLNELLRYKNPLVIKRFQRNYPDLKDDADALFVDMLQYLWLCKKHEQDKCLQGDHANLDFTCVMHREMTNIDEMWHTFILITQDYADFCNNYFGEFIHHAPEVGEEVQENVFVDKDLFEKELQLFLSYVYDYLGEATVRRWFSVYLHA